MNLVSAEAPATRGTAAREAIEHLYAAFRIVVAVHLLQVVPNELMETLAESPRFFRAREISCSSMDRVGNIHDHSTRAHVSLVKMNPTFRKRDAP
jgi:hypothetical protein